MVEMDTLNDIISIVGCIIFLLIKEINFIIVVILWYHLLRGIITIIIDHSLNESFLSINGFIDMLFGSIVFFRGYQYIIRIAYYLTIILFTKSIVNILYSNFVDGE